MLIEICEGLTYYRAIKDLEKEELLLWELIDLMRSPEVLKQVTKSYV